MIAVVAATKGRAIKLGFMLESVPTDIPVFLYATCTKDVVGADEANITFGNASIIEANNILIKKAMEKYPGVSVVVACDDIVFVPGAFDVIKEAVEKDDTKLYGFRCINMECKDDAFVCITRGVLEETGGSVYCEEYLHFYADTELGDKYKSLNRFETIEVDYVNYHPMFTGKADKTHEAGRAEKLRHDKEVYEARNLLYA